jgi:hypothetical protein
MLPVRPLVESALRRSSLRRLVLWAHLILGFIAIFVFYSRFTMPNNGWWAHRAGTWLTIRSAPVLLPYLVSAGRAWGLYTWQVDGPSRMRVVAFLAVLLCGAVVVNMTLLDAFGHFEGTDLIWLLMGQLVLYVVSGEWILNSI